MGRETSLIHANTPTSRHTLSQPPVSPTHHFPASPLPDTQLPETPLPNSTRIARLIPPDTLHDISTRAWKKTAFNQCIKTWINQ